MALCPDIIPPLAAIIAIGLMELFFPEAQIEQCVERLSPILSNPKRNLESVQDLMNHLARGWQATVDLGYTLLASATLLVTKAWQPSPSLGVFVAFLVVLILLNVALLVRCAVIGPERVAAIGIAVPFTRWWLTLRQISIVFVIAANLSLIIFVSVDCAKAA